MKSIISKNTRLGKNGLFINLLFVLFVLPFSFVCASNVSATTSTLTLSVIDKLSLNVSSLNSEGVFATSDLDTNNISVATNNGTGYLLGIKASTEGGNALINSTDSSKTIPSHTISAGVSKTNYNDPTYASANNLNNTWGFRPSTYYDATNNITIDNTTSNLYFPGPSSATNQFIIDKTSSANATANEYNIALGTRVNSDTAPGKYTDTFIITAVANPTIYSITYNQNTTDTVTNMPQNAINQETYGDSVNISNLVPVRDGYDFKGWCTVQVADGGTCSGTTYNPDGVGTDLAWTLNQTIPSNSLTIYAMWEQALTMQAAKLSDCGKTMPDSRDGQQYTTALIGDQCWMTTNLNLAGGTALSADDTDVTSAYISSFTTSNNLTKSGNTIVLPASTTDSGFDRDNYSYVANSGNVSSNCSNAPGCYSYYSWDAATLGSGRTIATDNANAEQSICPKGWHLPTTYNGSPNDSTDFRKLMIALGGSSSIQSYDSSTTPTGATMSSALQASPNNFLLAGGYYDGSFRYGGSNGSYWSSTSYSDNSNARRLYFSSSLVYSANVDDRFMGRSVRCVMNPKYMQEVDQWKDELTVGEQVKAVDNRDGHEYWVAKQADGNIWMTQNLDLDIGGTGVATLTSENTDLNVSGTAPYVDGYTTPGGIITWAPDATAKPSGRVINGTSVSGWTNDNNEPYSAEGGDRYYYTTGTTSGETMQTLAQCTAAGHSEGDCVHYHSGNYYNWTAAIASNASSGIGSTSYDVATNSICPKGWKLPQGRSSTAGDAATRQFGNLWYTSGIITSVSGSSYATNGFNNIRTSPLFFVRGGYVYGSSLSFSGSYGYYWSSSVYSTSRAYYATFGSSSINSANYSSRDNGHSIRCMVR